jgi:hypothetical protein
MGSSLVTISGGSSAYLNGAIYFPNATLNYTSQTTPLCTALVANALILGASSLSAQCFYGNNGANVMPQTQTVNLGG